MSFSCPHFCPDKEHCLRLNTDGVPGRRGCVLGGKTIFATPVEERIRLREEEKRRVTIEKSLHSSNIAQQQKGAGQRSESSHHHGANYFPTSINVCTSSWPE
jgi:hypothetical protein